MLFSSPRFFLFVAALLTLLSLPFSATRKKRLLAVASCLFYAAWDWRYLGLLLAVSGIDYWCAARIAATEQPRARKQWLLVSLVSNLGILGYFKYYNFFVGNWNAVAPVHIPHLEILLPAGVSFYTFKSMSYTIDVYRRELVPCERLIDYATFVTFFADLIAGPIVRASVFLPQMGRDIGPTRERVRIGASLFLLGISKKLLIADRMAAVVDPVFSDPKSYAATSIACAVVAYSVQIYADFSGYSDMALGTAKAIGYDLPENFNMPYLASSVTDFWRRWHMTLSNWLRDYLYIPLGGNRHGPMRTYVNLALTMLLGGLWHGASWNFVLWGALHGVGLAIHRAISRRPGAQPLPWFLAQPITLLFVMLCWIPFRAPTLDATRTIVVRLATFEAGGARFYPEALAWGLGMMIAGHALGAALERGLAHKLVSRVLHFFDAEQHADPVSGRYITFRARTMAGAFVVTTWAFAVFFFGATAVSPFIYFQF